MGVGTAPHVVAVEQGLPCHSVATPWVDHSLGFSWVERVAGPMLLALSVGCLCHWLLSAGMLTVLAGSGMCFADGLLCCLGVEAVLRP